MLEALAKKYLAKKGYMVLRAVVFSGPNEWAKPVGLNSATIEAKGNERVLRPVKD